MFGARDSRRGLAAALERNVVLAVDDERGRLHLRQSRAQVAGFTGLEDVGDAAAGQRVRVLGEQVEHPAAERRLGKARSYQLADMRAQVAFEVSGGVARDAAGDVGAALARAAD